jgi:tetratricopeptide (TPR) repeat protein
MALGSEHFERPNGTLRTMAKVGLFETLEQQIKPISVVVGLFTALSGVAAGWAADSAIVGASATILIALCVTNFWLWKNSRPPKPFVPALAERPLHRRLRWAFHVVSTVIGLAAAALIVILSQEAWAVRAIHWAFGCEKVASRAERYVAGKGRTDVSARRALALCYEDRKRMADAVAALEGLLNDQEALATIKAEERPSLLGFLHAEVGLNLLTSYDPALKTDAKRARQHLKEAALLHGSDWFVLDLLAYATAMTQTVEEAEVRQILGEAQGAFDSMPGAPTNAELAWQHFHWQGRTLYMIGAYAEAEKAFARELSLMPADDPRAVLPRGFLRAAEHGRTGDLSALQQYLVEAPTRTDRARTAVALSNALIVEADAADQRGDAQGAARIAKEAEVILAIALQLGAIEQDRVNLVRTAQLSVYSGRYGEAVSMWRQIVKEEPTNKTYWLWFGRAARRAALFEEARDALKNYVAMQPADPVGHSELGLAIHGLAQKAGPAAQSIDLFHAAEQELGIAAKLAPSDPIVAGLLRDAIAERGGALETGEARIRSFEIAVDWARRTRELLLGNASSSAASNATGRLAELLNDLAYYYLMENDDLATARVYVDECLELQPDLPFALDTKATILIRTAEKIQSASDREPFLREADDLLGRAFKALPASDRKAQSQYYEHKGRLAALQNDHAAAQASFRRALELDPSNVQARKQLR